MSPKIDLQNRPDVEVNGTQLRNAEQSKSKITVEEGLLYAMEQVDSPLKSDDDYLVSRKKKRSNMSICRLLNNHRSKNGTK